MCCYHFKKWRGIVIFIVEVQDKARNSVRKEYEGTTMREIIRIVENELLAYPHLYVNDIWAKGGAKHGLYGGSF